MTGASAAAGMLNISDVATGVALSTNPTSSPFESIDNKSGARSLFQRK